MSWSWKVHSWKNSCLSALTRRSIEPRSEFEGDNDKFNQTTISMEENEL